MIKSMTAFARADLIREDVSVSLEIRGYNSRYLDQAIKIPQMYITIEDKIRRVIADRITRGRIELKASIRDDSETAEKFTVNEVMARSYYDALMLLKKTLNLEEGIPFEVVAKKNGVVESSEQEIDSEKIWGVVSDCLERLLEEFDAMKAVEGQALAADLKSRVAFIEDCISRIEELTPDMLHHYQEKLRERINILTNGLADIDPARIAQESALLADRSDISEEIIRTRSHLDQFRQLMEAPSPSGRPLNFLLQEFNREFNTMGSKAGSAQISHIVVSAKTELEKIREQTQNIE
jgi:uncharacterized protein (TIGR00255 family)